MNSTKWQKAPSWWTARHETGWAKMKASMHRWWDKATGMPTPEGPDLDLAEPALRYGYGARIEFGGAREDHWDQLEPELEKEWSALDTGRDWAEARPHVLQGWHSHTRHVTGWDRGATEVRPSPSGFGAGAAGDSGSGTGASS